ncbi:GrpE, mitochondrial, partial [Coemansia spiralis]
MFRTAIARANRTSALTAALRPKIMAVRGPARSWRGYSDAAKPEGAAETAPEAAAEDAATKPVSAEEFRKLEKSLVEKDAKIKELKDAYLRSLADAENIRNRSKTEIESTKVFAIQKFAKDLLDTADILELALKHVSKDALADAA